MSGRLAFGCPELSKRWQTIIIGDHKFSYNPEMIGKESAFAWPLGSLWFTSNNDRFGGTVIRRDSISRCEEARMLFGQVELRQVRKGSRASARLHSKPCNWRLFTQTW